MFKGCLIVGCGELRFSSRYRDLAMVEIRLQSGDFGHGIGQLLANCRQLGIAARNFSLQSLVAFYRIVVQPLQFLAASALAHRGGQFEIVEDVGWDREFGCQFAFFGGYIKFVEPVKVSVLIVGPEQQVFPFFRRHRLRQRLRRLYYHNPGAEAAEIHPE